MSSKPTQIENMLAVVEILSRRIEELEAELAAVQKQRDSWQIGYGRVATERDEEREKWITAEAALAALRADPIRQTIVNALVAQQHRLSYYSPDIAKEMTLDEMRAARKEVDDALAYTQQWGVSQPYSHRNGEEEPPETAGEYWFQGTSYGFQVKAKVHICEYQIAHPFRSQDSLYHPPMQTYRGKWWGPIIQRAPWEE